MAVELQSDVCVLGGGAGGLAFATLAAQLGAKVVLAERAQLGGENLNRGTVPAAALIAAARAAQGVRQTRGFGIAPLTPAINFRLLSEHIQATVAAVAPNESAERLAGFGVQTVRGFARFEAPDRVSVGDQTVVARNFVVATGSSPAIPAIEGLRFVPHLTNETLFGNVTRFDHLIVLGANALALEIGQAFQRLGSRVSVITDGVFLPEFDPEISQPLLAKMRDEGMVLAEGVVCEKVERDVNGVRLHVSKDGRTDSLEGTHLLIMGGRTPNTEGLQLDRAGVLLDGAAIRVSRQLRTSNRQVYAIGDVTGGPPYATLARHHADVLVRRLVLGGSDVTRPEALPLVVVTDPELAHVGLIEREARKRHGNAIRVLRWPFSQNDRAVAERRTEGFVKIVASRAGTVLGATIIGVNAGELIQTWALAVSAGLNVQEVARSVAPYPSFAETSLKAAQGYTMDRRRTSRVGKALRMLPKMG